MFFHFYARTFFVPSLSHEEKNGMKSTGAGTWVNFGELLLSLGFCPLP
jgi:hypothetical protein